MVFQETKDKQQKNYQPLLLTLSIFLGLAAAVPAFLGIILWQSYLGGTFPPVNMILHRNQIQQAVIVYAEGETLEINDYAQISRLYRALISAEFPIGNEAPKVDQYNDVRGVKFVKRDNSVFVTQLGMYGGAVYCPELNRSYMNDRGGLLKAAEEIGKSTSAKPGKDGRSPVQ